MRPVLLALGSNKPGKWGTPSQNLRRALEMLSVHSIRVDDVSHYFESAPVGFVRQSNYVNIVARCATSLPPARLLRVCKRIERAAGRRLGPVWGPRPLDIDVIDYAGWRTGWRRDGAGRLGSRRAHLVLPHPCLHTRPFVLEPLREVAPSWRHPVLGAGIEAMLARLVRPRGNLRRGGPVPGR